MVWLFAITGAALAHEAPLYATDWTSGVDGASRTRVAQLVQGDQADLIACLSAEEGVPVEVTFGWEAGKPVRIEASGATEVEACVEREVSAWRADVKSAGPYTWSLMTGHLAVPPQAPPGPTTGGLGVSHPTGVDLSVMYSVPSATDIERLRAAIRARGDRFVACFAAEGHPTTVDVGLYALMDQLADAIVRPDGTCLADIAKELPVSGLGPVHFRFSVSPP